MRGFLRASGTLLVFAGVAVALFPLMTEAYGRHRQRVLREELQQEVAGKATDREGGRGLRFRLLIPKIWLDVVVTEGKDRKSLTAGPVHYPGTALPGEEGNCVISGHRNIYGSPFQWLDLLQPGDGIATQAAKGWAWYLVEEVRIIPPSGLEQVIFAPADARLTLLTCDPPFRPHQRLIVVAKPGTPSEAGRRWAPAPPPAKRTPTEGEEFNSPALQWLRKLAKEKGRPPELDEPQRLLEAAGRQQSPPPSKAPFHLVSPVPARPQHQGAPGIMGQEGVRVAPVYLPAVRGSPSVEGIRGGNY